MKTLILIALLGINIAFGQKIKCKCPIVMSKKELFNIPNQEIYTDSLKITSNDSSIYLINILNCKGKLSFSKYTRDLVLELKGNYAEALDTLKNYANVFDLEGFPIRYYVFKYFQPLRDGKWIYYNPDGSIKKQEEYFKGLLKKDDELIIWENLR
jgi:hypothetical protein